MTKTATIKVNRAEVVLLRHSILMLHGESKLRERVLAKTCDAVTELCAISAETREKLRVAGRENYKKRMMTK